VTTTATWTETRTQRPVFEKEYTVIAPQCSGGYSYIVVNIREDADGLSADVYGDCGPSRPMASGDSPLALACLWFNDKSQGCYYVYRLPDTQYIPVEPGTYRVRLKLFDLR